MLLKIHPDNPSARQIQKVVESLANGGIVVIPTDTVYGLACDINNPKAIEKIARIKGIKKSEANFSFIFHDLSQLSEYTKPMSNDVFKYIRQSLPGPFTFILKATNKIPKIFQNNKKTVGIRIPQNNIPSEIVKELGNPIMTTSIKDEDDLVEYTTDPELIHEKYEKIVDIVIDGGLGDNEPSTVIDCTGEEMLILREGKGEV
ncbi:MAG: threonylcarbamoyl-AMP synthase [Bacteroidales bacterium]|nr:threonylcarbamoyl-AMP synthase [Bacteroidales bacterium]MCF8388378.1 threonylcarbamoyl-AMP synthase [Bacteroidales bacterium]MCF8396535.1 threonylcarbamoyl-AMP synthase [Bacteroidales bacterium]